MLVRYFVPECFEAFRGGRNLWLARCMEESGRYLRQPITGWAIACECAFLAQPIQLEQTFSQPNFSVYLLAP